MVKGEDRGEEGGGEGGELVDEIFPRPGDSKRGNRCGYEGLSYAPLCKRKYFSDILVGPVWRATKMPFFSLK